MGAYLYFDRYYTFNAEVHCSKSSDLLRSGRLLFPKTKEKEPKKKSTKITHNSITTCCESGRWYWFLLWWSKKKTHTQNERKFLLDSASKIIKFLHNILNVTYLIGRPIQSILSLHFKKWNESRRLNSCCVFWEHLSSESFNVLIIKMWLFLPFPLENRIVSKKIIGRIGMCEFRRFTLVLIDSNGTLKLYQTPFSLFFLQNIFVRLERA